MFALKKALRCLKNGRLLSNVLHLTNLSFGLFVVGAVAVPAVVVVGKAGAAGAVVVGTVAAGADVYVSVVLVAGASAMTGPKSDVVGFVVVLPATGEIEVVMAPT